MDDVGAIPTRTLVLGMIREDGDLPAREVYDVADRLGMSGQQVRLCLRRLVAEGLLSVDGRGRSAVFRSGQPVESLLPGSMLLELAYLQDSGRAPWDGSWHLVALGISEAHRARRDRFREQLTWLGGAKLGGGLYVCANDWDDLVLEAARDLGIVDDITLVRGDGLRHKGLSDPRETARHLWPLQEIALGYRRFMEWLDQRIPRPPDDGPGGASTELAREAIGVTVAFVRAADRDPLLPPELLPPEFPGSVARRSFLRVVTDICAVDPGPNPPVILGRLDALRRAVQSG